MVEPPRDARVLAGECGAWSQYLVELEPSPAIVARYLEAHALGIVEPVGSESSFDRALVALARGAPFFARICDVHARIFRPAGLLRRKLVLTLALLETDASSHRRVDRADPGSRWGLLVRSALWALRFAVLAALGLVLLIPLRLACAFRPARGTQA